MAGRQGPLHDRRHDGHFAIRSKERLALKLCSRLAGDGNAAVAHPCARPDCPPLPGGHPAAFGKAVADGLEQIARIAAAHRRREKPSA